VAIDRDKFVQGFLQELEKRALDPISIGLGAAGGHFATNLALSRAMKNPKFMPDVLRQGYRHGLERKKTSPLREALVTKTIGPEVPMEYHKARDLGRIVRILKKAKNDTQKNRILNKITSKIGKGAIPKELEQALAKVGPGTSTPDLLSRLRKSRVGAKTTKVPESLEHINRAILRERVHQRSIAAGRKGAAPISAGARLIAGGKGVHEKSKPSRLGRAAQFIPEVAAGAGALAGSPLAAKVFGHIALNRGREIAAKTKLGKRLVGEEMKKGLEGKLSKTRQKLKSLVVSPGFSGVGDLGMAARRVMVGPEKALAPGTRLRAALAGRTREALSRLRGGLSRLRFPRLTRTGPAPAP